MFKKKAGIEQLKTRYGYMFVAPWIFGLLTFFIIPLIQCFSYSLSDVQMTPEGLKTEFVGLEFYKYLFIEDPNYLDNVVKSLSSLLTSVPIILALSMILAIILNQKFKGRLLARAVFFLPVIMASGAVMSVLSGFGMQDSLTNTAAAGQTSEYMQVIDFTVLLERLQLPEQINTLLVGYLSDTFNLIWSCGVQILLFVAGLQTIPAQLYEVGRVDGITAWEEFWFVTIPLMGRIILLVLFYTMVELFITDSVIVTNVVNQINKQDYSNGSAMIWPYFAVVGIIMGAVVFVYNKLCLKRWE